MFFNRVVFACLFLSFAVGCGFLYYQQLVLGEAIKELGVQSSNEAKRFNEALGRAEVKIDITGKLIETMSKDIPEDIRRDLDERNAEIVSIATARFGNVSGGGGHASVVLATSETVRPSALRGAETEIEKPLQETCDSGPYEWSFGDWRLEGSLKAYCGGAGKFNYKLNQSFELVQVQGVDGSYYVKLFELDGGGKQLGEPLKTEQFAVVQMEQRPNRFYWWAPHLDIAGSVNDHGALGAEAAISIMGYGRTVNDLSWKFIRGGVVYGSDVGAVLCPASYNVGGPLPLLSNLWLSPCYQYVDRHGVSISVGAQL